MDLWHAVAGKAGTDMVSCHPCRPRLHNSMGHLLRDGLPTTNGLLTVPHSANVQDGRSQGAASQDLRCQRDRAGLSPEEVQMPIVRNIDVTMQSEISFDDACRNGLQRLPRRYVGSLSFRVKEAECVVEHDKIIAYRVTGKIVFLVER